MKYGGRRKEILTRGLAVPVEAYGFHDQEYFHESLILERKRSERSKRPILLMTVSFESIKDPRENQQIVGEFQKAIVSVTRETDIKGWYRDQVVLGVLFTELNQPFDGVVEKRMMQSLRAAVNAKQLVNLEMRFHSFLEISPGENQNTTLPDIFYPDVPHRDQAFRLSLAAKRLTDIVVSAACLVALLPVIAAIMIGIKLGSRGPLIFRQERVGQFGKRFIFLKFRSMYVNNDATEHKKYVQSFIAGKVVAAEDACGQKVFKLTRDKRVTPFGQFLRKTSLDEIPQFFNVLRGEMSLIGPRPSVSYEFESYERWHQRRVIEVKPGITGLWQINGRSSTTFDEMVRLDLQYARDWNFWMDLKILIETPRAVVTGRGAY